VFSLRPYQDKALAACRDSLSKDNAAILQLPTGCGKTEVFVALASGWKNGRTLVVAPKITLVTQAARKLCNRTGIDPGIEQASQWSNESPWARSPFVVASKDTLTSKQKFRANNGDMIARNRYERFADVGLVVVDECHYAATSRWAEMLRYFQGQGAKILGVTATPERLDKRSLGQLFGTICYKYSIQQAVKDGWLVKPRCVVHSLESLDIEDVDTRSGDGDLVESQLGKKLEVEKVILEICEVIHDQTKDKQTAVYCASVQEAMLVAERLHDVHGLSTGWIASDTSRCPKQQREDTLRGFVSGEITHLANVGILTVGWDYPALECIAMARPTKSKTLFTQILGRGTRPLEGVVDFEDSTADLRRERIAASTKPDFLFLDLAANSHRHKLVGAVDILAGQEWEEEVKDRAAEIVAAGCGDIDSALEQAKEELDEEEVERQRKIEEIRQKERERIEKERRDKAARQRANIEYTTREVDVFSDNRGGQRTQRRSRAHMPWGKFKGQNFSDLPPWYLKGLLTGKCGKNVARWILDSAQRELDSRQGVAAPKPEKATADPEWQDLFSALRD